MGKAQRLKSFGPVEELLMRLRNGNLRLLGDQTAEAATADFECLVQELPTQTSKAFLLALCGCIFGSHSKGLQHRDVSGGCERIKQRRLPAQALLPA